MNRPLLLLLMTGVGLPAVFGQAPTMGCRVDRPLDFSVSQTSGSANSIVGFLLALGQQNRLCFGLATVDHQLFTRPVQFKSQGGSVRQILERALAPGGYRYSEEDGLIVVEPVDASKPGVLDFRMPRFVSDRRPAPSVAGGLFVQYRFASDPTLKGIAGRIPAPTLTNLTGPFEIRDTTVRRILNRIVAGSMYGGMWIAHDIGTSPGFVPEGSQAPWSVLSYDLPLDANLATVNRLGGRLQESP